MEQALPLSEAALPQISLYHLYRLLLSIIYSNRMSGISAACLLCGTPTKRCSSAVANLQTHCVMIPNSSPDRPVTQGKRKPAVHDKVTSSEVNLWKISLFIPARISKGALSAVRPMKSSPSSPDLNPLEFHLWGYLKALAYATPVDDVDTLHNRIVAGRENIRNFPGICQRMRVSMQWRVDAPVPELIVGVDVCTVFVQVLRDERNATSHPIERNTVLCSFVLNLKFAQLGWLKETRLIYGTSRLKEVPWDVCVTERGNEEIQTSNMRHWSGDNAHALTEAPLHPQKLGVWCAVASKPLVSSARLPRGQWRPLPAPTLGILLSHWTVFPHSLAPLHTCPTGPLLKDSPSGVIPVASRREGKSRVLPCRVLGLAEAVHRSSIAVVCLGSPRGDSRLVVMRYCSVNAIVDGPLHKHVVLTAAVISRRLATSVFFEHTGEEILLRQQYSYTGSPVSPALSFRRCSILTSITLIGSLDVDVQGRPNIFAHSSFSLLDLVSTLAVTFVLRYHLQNLAEMPVRGIDADREIRCVEPMHIRQSCWFAVASALMCYVPPTPQRFHKSVGAKINVAWKLTAHTKKKKIDAIPPPPRLCSINLQVTGGVQNIKDGIVLNCLYIKLCNSQEYNTLKAVHDKVSTSDINLRKKSLPLPYYIVTGAPSDLRPVKLATVERKVVPYHNVE
ncbi:hypothetical protein PR048_016768 [Dryococelus australis]|uniref:Uncharacterized protein n=1 Tax=Dryococelus australis TaxID=614101 RepID=A0ABQ9H7R5_9NEOP|nr:hypothetical protein PR048_016768 [Dryococelus australis]